MDMVGVWILTFSVSVFRLEFGYRQVILTIFGLNRSHVLLSENVDSTILIYSIKYTNHTAAAKAFIMFLVIARASVSSDCAAGRRPTIFFPL